MSREEVLFVYGITMVVSLLFSIKVLSKLTKWRVVSIDLISLGFGSISSYFSLALYGAVVGSADSDWLHSHLRGGSIMVVFGAGLILLVVIFEVILSKVLKKGKDSDGAQ